MVCATVGLRTWFSGVRRPTPARRHRPCLLRDAPLLLLDEATSALDAESERLVQRALERLMSNRTTVVLAQRLATVRAADRIIAMDQGRIVEEGNHDTLVAAGRLGARLARLQFEGLAGRGCCRKYLHLKLFPNPGNQLVSRFGKR